MSPRLPDQGGPVVLPVGGGKGGIGKSALTANLGLALARLEHTVTVVDADLGGSDLHNLLGLENQFPGLGEVLTSRDLEVAQVVHQVIEPRFFLVAGDAMVVATANPTYQKKRKVLYQLKRLPSQFILLDLGAGTAITTMDFFLTSPVSLLVMLPERPALLNAFNFLKNAIFRALQRVLKDNVQAGAALKRFQTRGRGPGAMKMEELLAELQEVDPQLGDKARKVVGRWRPKLVLNRVRRMDDFVYARQLERWVSQDLALSVEVLGFVPEDEVVREASRQGLPALELDPWAPFCQALTRLALSLSPWAGRPEQWARHREPEGSFERMATEYAYLFPPPGTQVPTREELLHRLRQLEAGLAD